MEKINYGDIDKFLASIGVVLIALSMLTPYFYLKENFGVYIPLEEFERLHDPVKEIVLSKQEVVVTVQKYILWISLGCFTAGAGFLILGLYRWNKRQKTLDEKTVKENRKLELEIRAMTPEEKEEKAREEIMQIEQSQKELRPIPKKVVSRYQNIKAYMAVERGISDAFIRNDDPHFEVLSQQKMGNRYRVDILLKSRSGKEPDRIVEIKYFTSQLSLKIVRDTIDKINTQISYYNEASGRSAIPVLLIVYREATTTTEDIQRFRERLARESLHLPNLSKMKVGFIEEKEVASFDSRVIMNG